ncbi:hypothetical protein [Agrococcus sp. SGAir0287]|uniref:hypothetical protein n=1 Tax=Agrococcus sp. SGAir0287 TaxID=2070347 RepID=UPI0010CD3D80|nr:hypothetical protein [Agrococcus sp. SGAir0287]QCR18345.1 hypothetical protein C1N71_01815 [Agrococcus sp. SGAir0287]
MVIWRGWGILVLFGLIAGLLLALFVIRDALPVEPAYAATSIAVGIGFVIGAVLALGVWLLRLFRIIDVPREVAPGVSAARRPSSSLFFIPLVAWPVILLVIGVLGIVIGSSEAA